jgi:hypothetical protein
VFAFHAVEEDFELEVAHAANHVFLRVLVAVMREGRVFLGQAVEGFAEFVVVGPRLRVDGQFNHGLGQLDLRQFVFDARRRDGIAEMRVLEFRHGREVAGADFRRLRLLFSA